MRNQILHGDCLELMKDIPDGSVDMILCDLPYGVTQHPEDVKIPFPDLWAAYRRIIKYNGCIALYAQGLFFAELLLSNPKWFRYDLVWNKVLISGFLNSKRMPLRQHEHIGIFYNKQPVYNPQMTQGNPLHSKGSAYDTKQPLNQNYGRFLVTDDSRAGSTDKYPTSVLNFPKPHPSVALHRTEKSIACNEWMIKTYTQPGALVLDNCAGSGTTGVACQNTGRDFILIEKDIDYYNIIWKRLYPELF